MPTVRYSKKITPEDVAQALGISPSNVTVEEDADEIRIILPEDVDVAKNIDKLDNLMKILRRKGT
jgi:hypothetical protein